MRHKFWETINGKIILMFILTTVITLAGVGYFSNYQVEKGFERFVKTQEQEFEILKHRPSKFLNELAQVKRYEEITNQFRQTLTRSIILSSVFGLSFSIIAGTIISSHITDPLRKLKKTMGQVSKNNYKIRAKEIGSSEIKELIREFNNLTSELERIEKLRANLVSDVSHELKTPLTKVRGQLEGVIDGIYKSDKNQIEKTLSNLDQLEYLVAKLQELTEIQAGKVQLKKTSIAILPLVENIISGYSEKDIEFILDIQENLKIKADKNKLTEILDNLVSNAYKFTTSGTITISADKEKIEIKDTGRGIPKKDLPYIFERFYRVDKSRSKDTGGLGLGLAIVKELAEAHQWEIKVKSSKKGTRFVINF